MDRTTDFGSVSEGSNPSAVTKLPSWKLFLFIILIFKGFLVEKITFILKLFKNIGVVF